MVPLKRRDGGIPHAAPVDSSEVGRLNLWQVRAKLLREHPGCLRPKQSVAQASAGAKRKPDGKQESEQGPKRARLPPPGVTLEEEDALTEEIASVFLSGIMPEVQEMVVRVTDPISRQALANVNHTAEALVTDYYEKRATLDNLLTDFAWHVDVDTGEIKEYAAVPHDAEHAFQTGAALLNASRRTVLTANRAMKAILHRARQARGVDGRNERGILWFSGRQEMGSEEGVKWFRFLQSFANASRRVLKGRRVHVPDFLPFRPFSFSFHTADAPPYSKWPSFLRIGDSDEARDITHWWKRGMRDGNTFFKGWFQWWAMIQFPGARPDNKTDENEILLAEFNVEVLAPLYLHTFDRPTVDIWFGRSEFSAQFDETRWSSATDSGLTLFDSDQATQKFAGNLSYFVQHLHWDLHRLRAFGVAALHLSALAEAFHFAVFDWPGDQRFTPKKDAFPLVQMLFKEQWAPDQRYFRLFLEAAFPLPERFASEVGEYRRLLENKSADNRPRQLIRDQQHGFPQGFPPPPVVAFGVPPANTPIANNIVPLFLLDHSTPELRLVHGHLLHNFIDNMLDLGGRAARGANARYFTPFDDDTIVTAQHMPFAFNDWPERLREVRQMMDRFASSQGVWKDFRATAPSGEFAFKDFLYRLARRLQKKTPADALPSDVERLRALIIRLKN